MRFWGFFKNEYVRARTVEDAAATAKTRVMRALGANPAVVHDSLGSLVLEVEAIESEVCLLRLLRREGFVFYDVVE